MMSLRTLVSHESLSQFTNGLIDDCLLHRRPHLDQTLFQLIHVTYGRLLHAFLNTARLDCGTCTMGRRAILLEHKHIACLMSDCRKHLV